MNTDVMEKVKQLPPDKQKEVEDFVDYLVSRYKTRAGEYVESLAEMRLRNMGWMHGQIWMADDFNETPEDFKEYM